MARFDKFEPFAGNPRAKLNAAILAADVGKIQGVSINASGRVVIGGAAVADIIGVICAVRPMDAGEVIDVMKIGEMADFDLLADGVTATIAGTKYYAAFATGIVTATNTGKLVGQMVEKGRLVVQVVTS